MTKAELELKVKDLEEKLESFESNGDIKDILEKEVVSLIDKLRRYNAGTESHSRTVGKLTQTQRILSLI